MAIQLRQLAPFSPSVKLGTKTFTEDTQLSGTIQVNGIITVAPEATLTIMPGTVIRLGAKAGISVFGRIVARGTAAENILFSSPYLAPEPADWYGIVLTSSGKKNVFEHVKIQGADTALLARASSVEVRVYRASRSDSAIKLIDAIAFIKDAEISAVSEGISAVKSELDIEDVAIEKGKTGLSLLNSSLAAVNLKISASSQVAMQAERSHLRVSKSFFSASNIGAMFTDCDGSITASGFTANIETGAVFSGSTLKFSSNRLTGNSIALEFLDSLPIIWGNSISGSSRYNIFYLGEEKFFIGGNWFGNDNSDTAGRTVFSKRPATVQYLPLLLSDPLVESGTGY